METELAAVGGSSWVGGGGGLWGQEESTRLQGKRVNRLALSCASPFVFINMLCGVDAAL